ncbi:c-type cytochrome, partial [Variovorax boronicumulans]
FNTPNDGTVPKLAGQHADYLFVALKSYRVKNNPHLGRSNAVMAAQVEPKKFTNAELKTLATYISSLPGELKVVPESRLHHAPQ